MAVKPIKADSDAARGTADIDALNEVRLSRNWSYQQLADDMVRTGHGVHSKTLQTLVAYRPKPYDRTLYQIRKYLAVVREEAAAAAPKKVPA